MLVKRTIQDRHMTLFLITLPIILINATRLCAVYAFNVCTTYGRQADSGLHCVVVIRSSVPM